MAERKAKKLPKAIRGLKTAVLSFAAEKPETIEVKVAIVPVQMILFCPMCGGRHIDVDAFAMKPHHTHACQHCGFVWRPAIVDTVGVEYLPGFKNAEVSRG